MKRSVEARAALAVGIPLAVGSVVAASVFYISAEAQEDRISVTMIDVPQKQREIDNLVVELKVARADLTRDQAAFELSFGGLSDICRQTVRPFIVDGPRANESDEVALRETTRFCSDDPTAVISLRDMYDDLLVLDGRVTQLDTSIAANLAAINVQPPTPTTQG